MKRNFLNHLILLQSHILPTQQYYNHKKTNFFTLKKASLMSLLAITSLGLPACTSDNVNEVRIIEDKKDDKAENSKATGMSAIALNKANIKLYDISNNKEITSIPFNISDKIASKKSKDITQKDKGNEGSILVKKDNIEKQTTLLSVLTANENDSNVATYYEPTLNKLVAIPKNKPLMALANVSSGKSIDVINPTPLTTLAIYRSLARIGWFFDHDKLPTVAEFTQIINNNSDFIYLYNTAIYEIMNSMTMTSIDLPPLSAQYGLKDIVKKDSSGKLPSSDLSNWMVFLSQLHVYKNKYNNATPYFSFAHDLAKDFIDGDIDGATWYGLGVNASNKLTNPLVAFKANTSRNINDIYLTQQPVLLDFESKISSEIAKLNASILTKVKAEDKKDVQKILSKITNQFSTTDPTENAKSSFTRETIVSYADYKTANSPSHAYRGIGNQSPIFSLSKDTTFQQNLNIDIRFANALSFDGFAGKYTNGACTLKISDIGKITLDNGTGKTTVLVDRELQDTVFKKNTGYEFNISSKKDKKRLFVVLNLANDKVISASMGESNNLTATKPSKTNYTCRF